MADLNLEEFLKEWDSKTNGIPPEESTLAARLEILTYRCLAKGQPVSAQDLAAAARVPVEITQKLFEHGRAQGGEWDAEGRLLGNVLTLIPTPHRFHVNGRDLYTWCSLDAMHLPGLLNQTAEVRSVDPLNGQEIQLTIPPDDTPVYKPSGTVLSIVLSGGERNGPGSLLCQQMHFFASRDTAETWVKEHPQATIMSVEEVYQLVNNQVHAPLAEVLKELA